MCSLAHLPTILAPRHCLLISQIKHLAPAAIPLNCDSFAFPDHRLNVNIQHIACTGALWQVHGLRDGIISIFLESSLNFHMLLRGHVQSYYNARVIRLHD
jgi:hypothetical protein